MSERTLSLLESGAIINDAKRALEGLRDAGANTYAIAHQQDNLDQVFAALRSAIARAESAERRVAELEGPRSNGSVCNFPDCDCKIVCYDHPVVRSPTEPTNG